MPPKKRPPKVKDADQYSMAKYLRKDDIASKNIVIDAAVAGPSQDQDRGGDAPVSVNNQVDSGGANIKTLKFQQEWLLKWDWLRYDNKESKMYCTLCERCKFKNTMALGTSNLKTTTIDRHSKSEQHEMAVNAPLRAQNMAKAVDTIYSDKDKAILVCFKAVNWLCCESLPLSKYTSLMSLLKDVNTPDINLLAVDKRTDYTSYKSAADILLAMSDQINGVVTQQLKYSPVLTILTDESTNIMVHHKMVINCQIVNPTTLEPSTLFLTDIRITSATGKGLYDTISQHLDSRNIPVTKITQLGTDGASVMTGRKQGLTGHILRQNPHLINSHCSAHRIALCSEQAANHVPAMKEYQKTLENLYYHFKKSPVKTDKLQAIQKVLDDPQIKIREVHNVRWLSFYIVIDGVYRTLDSLQTYLAEAGTKDPVARGLHKKMASDFFISTTYYLMDILQPIMKLNLFFQRKDVDIGSVKVIPGPL